MPRTYQHITADHRAAYLKALAATGSHPAACRAIGFSRAAVAAHLKANDEFADQAEDARHMFADTVLAEIKRRAIDGVTQEKLIMHGGDIVAVQSVTKYSDRLLLRLAEVLGPEAFRAPERIEHVHTHSGHIDVHNVIDADTFRRLSPQARLEYRTAVLIGDVKRGAYPTDAGLIDDITTLSIEADKIGAEFDAVAFLTECKIARGDKMTTPAIETTYVEIAEPTIEQIQSEIPV